MSIPGFSAEAALTTKQSCFRTANQSKSDWISMASVPRSSCRYFTGCEFFHCECDATGGVWVAGGTTVVAPGLRCAGHCLRV
jgi:hypothetical protein